MKKILIFICCIVSLGVLVGCSNDSDDIKTNVKVDVGNIKTVTYKGRKIWKNK